MSETSYKKRAQVLLTEEQYSLLEECAQAKRLPLGAYIREVLEDTVIKEEIERKKEAALRWLSEQRLPVADWPEMEREIEKMWEEPHGYYPS
ncbi:MAG: hypothetical protein HW403_228 [Dehalococcoidia bacterium]|nr:hypothetical protein [Dehalococcoidia bacterium]